MPIFMMIADQKLSEMRLMSEGAIVIYEDYSLKTTGRPREYADLYNMIGTALYALNLYIDNLQAAYIQEIERQIADSRE